MPDFPRLSSVFGVAVSALDADAIAAAIERNEFEAQDLDWKADHYPRDKTFELAKDIAALANTVASPPTYWKPHQGRPSG